MLIRLGEIRSDLKNIFKRNQLQEEDVIADQLEFFEAHCMMITVCR